MAVDTWKTSLVLSERHREWLDDVDSRARRAGSFYRPSMSGIVVAVLDTKLPVLLRADFGRLDEATRSLHRDGFTRSRTLYALADVLRCAPREVVATVEALVQDRVAISDRVLDILDRYGIGDAADLIDAVLKLCDDYERVQREALALERTVEQLRRECTHAEA